VLAELTPEAAATEEQNDEDDNDEDPPPTTKEAFRHIPSPFPGRYCLESGVMPYIIGMQRCSDVLLPRKTGNRRCQLMAIMAVV
jgi:hypothetical protein